MLINRIELKNFRNYNDLLIELDEGINLIYGENGSGKTNIVEALYWVAMMKSFRTSEDINLVKYNQKVMRVSILSEHDEIKKEIAVEYNSELKKKIFKINEKKVNSGQFIGEIPIIIFAPENIMIIKGEPLIRRNYIDDLIVQIDKAYYQIVKKYNKIVSHRNYLLKQIRDNQLSNNVLDIWNKQLIEEGIKVVLLRMKYIEEINNKLKNELVNEKLNIHLNYYSKNFLKLDETNIKFNYEQFFIEHLNDEIARSITLIGPHRDDIEIYYNNQLAKQFASEGQQRISVILLKLAEGLVLKQKKGFYPLILLDDFSSELDNPNKDLIIRTFGLFNQIIITTTYKENLKNFKISNLIEIKEGKAIH